MTRVVSWGADVVTKRLFAVVAVMALAGCALDKQTTPPLAGPSELGLSLAISATPDIITQDGHSQAMIEVIARDASSQPLGGVALRAETFVNGTPADFGTLSSKSISTGGDGRATLTYRAPAAPAPSQASDIIVTLALTPVGTNYAGAVARYVEIRLARPGVIMPPNGLPKADFFFSPTAPRAGDDVYFDGSGSSDSDGEIVSYSWTFGDGDTEVSSSPTARHSYDLAGTYTVVLTVTDDRGLTASSSAEEIAVGTSADPEASFVSSPAAPKVNSLVSFNASASKGAEGRSITEYQWDFGDGTPVVSTASPVVTHMFGTAATYTVTLRVTDSMGKFAAVSEEVEVAPLTP
jgi:PKD repeat protein